MARADNRVFKIVLLVIGVVMLGLHILGGPLFYYAPSFSARVIDEETQEPIEGVAVLAAWWVEGGLLHPSSKVLHVEEALTNNEGVFIMDGWWPRLRPPMYRMEKRGPVLVFYKDGYKARREINPRVNRSWKLKSFWSGKVIPMERHSGSREDLKRWHAFARGNLNSVQFEQGQECCPLATRAFGDYMELDNE